MIHRYQAREFSIQITNSEHRNLMLGWQTLMPRYKEGIWEEVRRYDKINIVCKNGVGKIEVEEVYEFPNIQSGMTERNFMRIVPNAVRFIDAFDYIVFRLRKMDWKRPFLLVQVKVIE